MPARPKTLDVLTIAPLPCSSSTGRNARTPCTTPSKFTACSHSSSSGEASATVEVSATPALLNTAPIGAGAHSRTAAANASWPWRSRTSSGRGSDGPASRPAVSSRPRSWASAMATGQPWPERRTARARPIPEAAPVMTAVRPASGGTVVRAMVLDRTRAGSRLTRRYLEQSDGNRPGAPQERLPGPPAGGPGRVRARKGAPADADQRHSPPRADVAAHVLRVLPRQGIVLRGAHRGLQPGDSRGGPPRGRPGGAVGRAGRPGRRLLPRRAGPRPVAGRDDLQRAARPRRARQRAAPRRHRALRRVD